MPAFAPAQDVTEAALKAAYIFNFLVYSEWPADALASNAPLGICVAADNALADTVQNELKGRTVRAHPLSISRNSSPASTARGCNLLYLSGGSLSSTMQSIQSLRDAPVLTISDVEGFAEGGGITQFYFEHGRLKFIINMAALKRSRLQISARLLAIAKRI